MYQFTYQGQWLSINAAYSKHFQQRNKVKNQYKELFKPLLLEAQIPPLEAFTLHLAYNSRMDADNTTAGTKVVVDTMRELGIIREDNKHIYRGITITPDLSLRHNTYIVTIYPQSTPE